MEVRGGFPAREGDQARVLQAEGHFEGEGAAGVGEEMRCYCAGEAGRGETECVCGRGLVCV